MIEEKRKCRMCSRIFYHAAGSKGGDPIDPGIDGRLPAVTELLVGGRWGPFPEEMMSFNGRDNVREVRTVSDGCFSSGMYSLRSDRSI